MRKYHLWLGVLVLVSSCQLGPKYETPCVETSETWKSQTQDEIQVPCVNFWWQVFEDSTLDWLEQQAIAYNPNLYAALDRVAQARAIAGVDRAALYPQLTLNPSYYNSGILFKIFIPGGILPNIKTDSIKPFRIHQQQYNLISNLSYELDLWNRLRGQYQSSIFHAQAEEENYHNALLTLTADVASSYFQVRTFDSLIRVAEDNLDLLRRSLELTQSRYDKGLVSELDVVTAAQQFSDTEATYYDLYRQRVLQENILATLLGLAPVDFCLESAPLEMPPPIVPANLPSCVLMRRPDIAAAERTMASEHALIGVAYASFFPSIQLTGALGFSSPTFHDFLTWKSRFWAMGMNAAQTLFDAGRNISNLNLAYARFNEVYNKYQEAVLTAFQEVENALANLEWLDREYQSDRQSVLYAEKRNQLSLKRYQHGLTNYLDVIDSERTALQAELNAANVLGQRYQATIQLIKAIGGGWGCCQ